MVNERPIREGTRGKKYSDEQYFDQRGVSALAPKKKVKEFQATGSVGQYNQSTRLYHYVSRRR